MIENAINLPVLSYYCLPRSFLVLVGKINMFFLEKLRMEMKCHHYDVTDVDVLNLFSHTKMRSDMETDFP